MDCLRKRILGISVISWMNVIFSQTLIRQISEILKIPRIEQSHSPSVENQKSVGCDSGERGVNPKCRNACAVAMRPRGVRCRNPCCSKNGS